MISDKIRNIVRELRNRADDESLKENLFLLAMENLEVVADEVAAMEGAPVPANLRGEIAGNVVSLDRARKGCRHLAVLSGGGDAA